MGQLLRLHFENKDHTFRILNDGPVTRETSQVDLLLDGIPLVIIKNGQSWVAKEQASGIPAGLITAIAKAIALRFRI
jgi:hypothetical protein